MTDVSTNSPSPASDSPTAKKPGSPVRLVVLLVVMLVLLGGLIVDLFVFQPSVEAAVKRLNATAKEYHTRGIEATTAAGKKTFLGRDEVHEIVGRSPSFAGTEDGTEVEIYRWWGPLPINRRIITVMYNAEGWYNGYKVSNPNPFGGDEEEEENQFSPLPEAAPSPEAKTETPITEPVSEPPTPTEKPSSETPATEEKSSEETSK